MSRSEFFTKTPDARGFALRVLLMVAHAVDR